MFVGMHKGLFFIILAWCNICSQRHVCMYLHVPTQIYRHTYTCTHVFRHMCAHIHTGIAWVFVQIRAYSSRYIHTWVIWASIYTCTSIYTYIYTCTHKQLLWPPDAVPTWFWFHNVFCAVLEQGAIEGLLSFSFLYCWYGGGGASTSP